MALGKLEKTVFQYGINHWRWRGIYTADNQAILVGDELNSEYMSRKNCRANMRSGD